MLIVVVGVNLGHGDARACDGRDAVRWIRVCVAGRTGDRPVRLHSSPSTTQKNQIDDSTLSTGNAAAGEVGSNFSSLYCAACDFRGIWGLTHIC